MIPVAGHRPASIAPWQAEPYRLRSLLGMKAIDLETLGLAIANLAAVRGIANSVAVSEVAAQEAVRQVTEHASTKGINLFVGWKDFSGGIDQVFQPIILERLTNVKDHLDKLTHLSDRFRQKFQRLTEAVSDADRFDSKRIEGLVEELLHDLMTELAEPAFLYIEPEKRRFYEQSEPPFGQIVWDVFADAQRDVAAAGRCLGLNEWTACVVHLMRALEPPLRVIAGKVGTTFPTPMEFENWKNIIDKIESDVNAHVKALEQTKKGIARSVALKSYGNAVLQFRHFKNMWRNNAAHSREHYDERDAQRAYDAVKDLMETVALVVLADSVSADPSVLEP
jgi:hypothetical protein